MKRILYLFLLLLMTSCYKEVNEFPNQLYVGNWHNDLTFINGVRDEFHPFNKVSHYNFGIAQSEVTLSTETNIGTEYQNWVIDNTTTPFTLFLYKMDVTSKPDMIFTISKEPYFDNVNGGMKMEITYQDTITYQLSK